MRTQTGRWFPSLLLAALVVLSLLAATAPAAEGAKACCFNNPRYTGTCEVTPAENETCADILAYLNNPSAVGRQYCGNTNVRGGWQQVACPTASRADAETAAPACVGAPETPQPRSTAR